MSSALKQLSSPLRTIIKRPRNFSTSTRALKHYRNNRTLATMPVFPRFASNTLSEFRPLFRMFDDPSFYEFPQVETSRGLRAFSPNFDVHETDKEYVLEGELPGLSDKSNVSIEFTDHNTLLVRGKIEKTYESGTPPDQQQNQAQMSGANEGEKKSHKPTVEDENSEKSKQVTKTDGDQNKQVGQPTTKYWVSERSVGSFQRSFSFPGEIDQDAVSAKLKDGILTVKVPKRQQRASKRINIE